MCLSGKPIYIKEDGSQVIEAGGGWLGLSLHLLGSEVPNSYFRGRDMSHFGLGALSQIRFRDGSYKHL